MSDVAWYDDPARRLQVQRRCSHEQIDALSQETAGKYGRCAACGAYLHWDGDWVLDTSEERQEAAERGRVEA